MADSTEHPYSSRYSPMADSTEHPYSAKFDPYFTAIGRVANAYSQLEFKMNDAIWELANVARMAGVCMTAQMMGPAPRNRCLLALLKFRNASNALITDFNKIGNKIESVAARRNRYVHDPFVLNQDTGKIERMESTADKSIRHGFISTEIDELNQLATDIETVDYEFDQLYLRAVAELTPMASNTIRAISGHSRRSQKAPLALSVEASFGGGVTMLREVVLAGNGHATKFRNMRNLRCRKKE